MSLTAPRALLVPPAILVALALGSCDRPPTGPADYGSHLQTRGMTVGDWTTFGIASEDGRRALDEIADLGVDTAVFVVTVYQDELTSNDFGPEPETKPHLDAFRQAAAYARSLDLKIALKLHVDLRDGEWRGYIRPADPAAWFADYGGLVEDCAGVAQAVEAEYLVVGTELACTIHHEDLWRSLIAAARERFDGAILYAASWDEVEMVPFWDAVDAIGLDFYFPVSDRMNPSRLEILSAWQPWLDRMQFLSMRARRDIVLTEIGYTSRDGAGMEPAAWGMDGRPDPAEQADLYWAALQAVAGESWIRGVWWWNWELRCEGGPEDLGYTPRGKPAREELRSAWTDP